MLVLSAEGFRGCLLEIEKGAGQEFGDIVLKVRYLPVHMQMIHPWNESQPTPVHGDSCGRRVVLTVKIWWNHPLDCNFATVKILAHCWTPPRTINPSQSSHLASEIWYGEEAGMASTPANVGTGDFLDRCFQGSRENFLRNLCDNLVAVCTVDRGVISTTVPTEPQPERSVVEESSRLI